MVDMDTVPKGFCVWAWAAIEKDVSILALGVNAPSSTKGWQCASTTGRLEVSIINSPKVADRTAALPTLAPCCA